MKLRHLTVDCSCTIIMYMSGPVIPMAEARRRLPELVRKVAEGHAPIAIGRRGRMEAVIARAGTPEPVAKRPLRGLIRIMGGGDSLERANEDLRRVVEESLERTALLLVREPPRATYRSKPSGTKSKRPQSRR